MKYKYKKYGFGKKLDVPSYILSSVYNCTLSFEDMLKYDLIDKIPASCLIESDRVIVEHFGIEKAKKLDWKLIYKREFYTDASFREFLLNVDPNNDNINLQLYEFCKDLINPSKYTDQMVEVYKDRFFDLHEVENDDYLYEKSLFNDGILSLKDIFYNWEIYQDKDISYCLMCDENNTAHITPEEFKAFVDEYRKILKLIFRFDKKNIYEIIDTFRSYSDEEKKTFIKEHTDQIVQIMREKNGKGFLEKIYNDEYAEIFKYSSLTEFLAMYDEYAANKLAYELKSLSVDYIFNSSIPFDVLCTPSVLSFIGEFGFKNVIDFDNECGHFFTKNNCETLKNMESLYMHYAGNEHNPEKNIYATSNNKRINEEGNYVGRLYTKEQFYESMRRMIVNGPSNASRDIKVPDYRDIQGEFRKINDHLFLSEEAPDILKTLFYTKNLTPIAIRNYPEFIPFLEGKDLSVCFKRIELDVKKPDSVVSFQNFYTYLEKMIGYEPLMDFLTEYAEIIGIAFNRSLINEGINISINDDFDAIKTEIINRFITRIIKNGIKYPNYVPIEVKKQYPNYFLPENAPLELQNLFYTRALTSQILLEHPEYISFIKDLDPVVIFKFMPESRHLKYNLVEMIKQLLGHDKCIEFMLSYGRFVEKIYDHNKLIDLKCNFTNQEEVTETFVNLIYKAIINGDIEYDEKMPEYFTNKYPDLFLSQDIDPEIRQRFYRRELLLADFTQHPDLVKQFKETNVALGFPLHHIWLAKLFNNFDNSLKANLYRLKVYAAYYKINDVKLADSFKNYVEEYQDVLDIDKIDYITEILQKLSLSNSSEIVSFKAVLAHQILRSANPSESLSKIENVFLHNHMPTVGKLFSCFDILHPDFENFDVDLETANISPVLKKSSVQAKKIIVFTDLIKAAFGSNNRSLREYLNNIDVCCDLYESVKLDPQKYETLSAVEMAQLRALYNYLTTLYANTEKGRNNLQGLIASENNINDLKSLEALLMSNNKECSLKDRIVRMFCGFIGIDSMEEAKTYLYDKIQLADKKNRYRALQGVVIEEGDFIKGIGNITYLKNILQNGSLCREYLGANAKSDLTPLDNDVSMITTSGNISSMLASTDASNYGPIWFVLKNDERFNLTRRDNETLEVKRDFSKLEVFSTNVLSQSHYGIRTGFASSEIDYILMQNYDPRVGLEIALNGFYIPVIDMSGNLLFTPEQYDEIRTKMSGLSYYDENDYVFSESLINENTAEIAAVIFDSNNDIENKRQKINAIFARVLNNCNLQLKTFIDGDLSTGFAELIDTGSTGRGTNMPYDGDFDFMLRLDRQILFNTDLLEKLKSEIIKEFGIVDNNIFTSSGDLRLKNVQIDTNLVVDIDITFAERTDKLSYSTDMALQDCLSTIQKKDPKKYKYVIANIIAAKAYLKNAGVYKPDRGEVPQGGLGGIGIENWILQNGGSFEQAAKSFIAAADGKTFAEFVAIYPIWDFGGNHLAEKRGTYAHDNFVANNMSEIGYQKMVSALKEYLKQPQMINENQKTI